MTNHDELCEKVPRYMFHIDEDGKASMMQNPIGAYIHIADLKQALKLSGSCEGSEKFLEELADMIDFNDQEQSLMNIAMTLRFRFEQNAQMTGGKK